MACLPCTQYILRTQRTPACTPTRTHVRTRTVYTHARSHTHTHTHTHTYTYSHPQSHLQLFKLRSRASGLDPTHPRPSIVSLHTRSCIGCWAVSETMVFVPLTPECALFYLIIIIFSRSPCLWVCFVSALSSSFHFLNYEFCLRPFCALVCFHEYPSR